MQQNFSEKQIRHAELVGRDRVYVLIDKGQFEEIPLSIRSYATDATEELLDSLGFVFSNQQGPLYLFSSEATFIQGAAKLKSLPNNRGREQRNIRIRPSRLFDRALKRQTKDICVDFGQPYSFTINYSELSELARMSSVGAIALLEKIHIVQGKGGFAVPFEIDGKNYVVGFINPLDADDTVRKLGGDEAKIQVEANNIGKLTRGLLESDLAGLLMNPGTDAEFILEKEDLEYLLLCVDVIQAGKPGTLELIRNLFVR